MVEKLYNNISLDLCRRCCGTGSESTPDGGSKPCELCDGTGVVQVEKEVIVRVTAFKPFASSASGGV